MSSEQVFGKALGIVRQVQGMGSGADIMASLNGGVGFYPEGCYKNLEAPELLGRKVALFATYCGVKTATPGVVHRVEQVFMPYPELLSALDKADDTLTSLALKHLGQAASLGELLNISSGWTESLKVHTQKLSQWLWDLRSQSYGVKLSGSGLGDCAVGVVKNGHYPSGSFPSISPLKG